MHVKIKRFLAVFQCDLLVLGRITSCTSLDLVFIFISNWSAEGCVREDWKMKKFKRVCDRSLSLSLSLLNQRVALLHSHHVKLAGI